jgi:hypothetical protein
MKDNEYAQKAPHLRYRIQYVVQFLTLMKGDTVRAVKLRRVIVVCMLLLFGICRSPFLLEIWASCIGRICLDHI